MKPTKVQIGALARRDPILGKVMSDLPPFPELPVKPVLPYFHTLARTIISQQLAIGAARTIHGRVKALSSRPRRFPTAGEFLSVPESELRGQASPGINFGQSGIWQRRWRTGN